MLKACIAGSLHALFNMVITTNVDVRRSTCPVYSAKAPGYVNLHMLSGLQLELAKLAVWGSR